MGLYIVVLKSNINCSELINVVCKCLNIYYVLWLLVYKERKKVKWCSYVEVYMYRYLFVKILYCYDVNCELLFNIIKL